MTDAPVRFGLFGYGAFGVCHAQAMDEVKGAQLIAVADPSDERRAEAAKAHAETSVYADYKELLANESLDVVDIVVPNYLHCEMASAAIDAGHHILLEKPMSLNIADCRSLIAQAAKADRTIAIGHEFRLSSLWGRVKQIIDAGEIGEPKYCLVELSRHPYRLGQDGWRYDIDRVGDWILEEPIHFFDLARWYLSSAGDPVTVSALASSRQTDHPELQDNLSALIRHDNGAYAVVTQTLAAFEHHQTVKVTGTKGAVWASWGGTMGRTLDPTYELKYFDGDTIHQVEIEKKPGELFELRTQIERMMDTARGGASGLPDGSDGMWSVALCQAAGMSARESREIAMRDLVGR